MIRKARDLRVKFDGKLHEVDVTTYIDSLSCLSTIVKEISRELDPNKKVEIKVKAHKEGSFEVILNIVEDMGHLMSSENVDYLSSLLNIIISVLLLKQFLRGEKPREVIIQGNDNKIIASKGDVTIVDQRVYNSYIQNVAVNNAIQRNFKTLSNDVSVTGFEISDGTESPSFSVRREEFEVMSVYNEALVPLELPKSRVITKVAGLHILKVVFEGQGKWQFNYNGNKIQARIDCAKFRGCIESGESFAKGDMLEAVLEIEQIYDTNAKTYYNDSYRVVEVLKHIPGDQKNALDLFQE